jgi:4-hydroxybenzoate polyprenyltransferase/predicted HAD superfamily phosphohydrolase YqeG
MSRSDITFSQFVSSGIKDAVIFLDVDGTLVPDGQGELPQAVIDQLRGLSKSNDVYLCSNGSHGHANDFAQRVDARSLACRKPFSGPMRYVAPEAKRRLVVGDKYLTDGLLAHSLKAEFIKIAHLRGSADRMSVRLSYMLDDIIWAVVPYFMLVRPWHWIKNILVLAPVFFAVRINDPQAMGFTVMAFIACCVSASLVYVVNDIFDQESDREHPTKRFRPLAHGDIGMRGALASVAILALLDVGLLFAVQRIIPPLVVYMVLNLLYSKWIKGIAVADIVCVSSFYLLRILIGGLAAAVYISPWIILCTFFGSLFIIIGKRRSEYFRDKQRAVLAEYSKEALDLMLISSLTLAVISYGIWSVIGHDLPYLVYSTLFVLFAVFRTLNRIYASPEQAESPETLVFKDRWIFGSFALWVLYIFFVFYYTYQQTL